MIILFSVWKKWFKIGIVILVLLTLMGIIIIETTLQPLLHNICETTVTGVVTKVIQRSIKEQTSNIVYNDLVTVDKNQEGQVVLMQPNLQRVNNLASRITLNIQQNLEQKKGKKVEIPISQAAGIEILSPFVPIVEAQIMPYSAVNSQLKDEFKSVGINQTKHKIYLEIISQTEVVVPLLSTDIKVNTEVPLTEAVIVGQVPEVYVGVEEGIFQQE